MRGKGRERLLTESLRLFASRGVEAVSVRDIAASTGLTNPALFRHFAGKEELAKHLFETCYRHLVSVLDSAVDAKLVDWLEAALREVDRCPEAVLFVLDNLKRYWSTLPDDLKRRPLPRLILELIAREKTAGRMRADAPDQLIATVVFGTLGQVARSVHFYETTIDPPAMARGLADIFDHGLSPTTGTGGDSR
jgi:AcrR family transcriptional regulator